MNQAHARDYMALIQRKLEALPVQKRFHYASGLREFRVLCEMCRKEGIDIFTDAGVESLNALVDDAEFEGEGSSTPPPPGRL
jgi:hypothetical protein